jgi:hypothetical protein
MLCRSDHSPATTARAVPLTLMPFPIRGPMMDYAEDNPANHRSGVAVLIFHTGKPLPPELLEVLDQDAGIVDFGG